MSASGYRRDWLTVVGFAPGQRGGHLFSLCSVLTVVMRLAFCDFFFRFFTLLMDASVSLVHVAQMHSLFDWLFFK